MGELGELERFVVEADAARLTLWTAERGELVSAVQVRARDLLATIDPATRSGEVDQATAVLCGFFVPLVQSEDAAAVAACLDTLLTRASELRDPSRRFQLHEQAYVEAFLKGESADDHCRVLFTVAASTASDDLLARALTARCLLGLRDDAASVVSDAATLAEVGRRLGDDFHAAFAPHMLANLREMQGDPAGAIKMHNESSRLLAEAGADHLVLTEVINLAACHLDVAEVARRRFAQTQRLMGHFANSHLEPELLSCLATLIDDEGDPDTAALLVGASEATQQRQDRVMYPAETKVAERTRLRLE